MADNEFNQIIEKINQIKALVKSIEGNIKNERKSIQGIRNKNNYTKIHADDFIEVYRQYGQVAYLKYVPAKYRKLSIKNAIESGRYMDLFDIHGEDVYSSKMLKIMKRDIAYESKTKIQKIAGYVRYVLPIKASRIVKERVAPISIALLMTPASLLVAGHITSAAKENKEHQVEIEEYLDDIREYAGEMRKFNLTPLQTMMKITDDMWARIDGYGDPKIDLVEYAGLDVSKSMGVGVCRNMADDCARRLNAIDPRYNARVIPVLYTEGDYQKADVDTRRVKTQGDVDETSEQSDEKLYENNLEEDKSELKSDVQSLMDKFISTQIKDKIGNHAVVLVDIPEDKITLVLDPTNAGVGLYHNGKITMFNSMVGAHPLEMRTTSYGGFVYGLGTALIDQPNRFISSIGFFGDERLKYLNEKYGIEAQNSALRSIRKYEKTQYMDSLKVGSTCDIQKEDCAGKDAQNIMNNDLTTEEDVEK